MASKESAKGRRADPFAQLFSPLRPSNEELAKVRAAEKSGDPQQLIRQLAEVDRKYKARSIEALNVETTAINHEASYELAHVAPAQVAARAPSAALLGALAQADELDCDCVVPFQFRRLDVYTDMSGPEQSGVARGVIGANRWGPNEYTVWNPGDTTGKGRVPVNGQMHMTFSARLPEGGRWCLLMPTGSLWVRGHSRVVGHGNWSTSYDAKVWVHYYQLLYVGAALIEIAGGGIHYDGTRSEDRTRFFNSDRWLPQRYVFFNAAGPNDVVLSLRVEVSTEANEDGLATGVVDLFGLPANTSSDYDTFVIKA